MDYAECLKVHGYIAGKSDSENSNVEEIYNKYKPTPVPYREFKHRVVTIYADSGTTSESRNTSSSSTFLAPASATVQPRNNVQRNLRGRNRSTPDSSAVARPVSNVNSGLQQQQLDQFLNSYQQQQQQQQQRTDTPIRDILSQPNTVRGRTRVKSPPPVVPPQPASRAYTLTPATNIPGTERRVAVHSEPARPPSPRNDIQVPYRPLEPRRHHQQQQQEEEMNDCCCCIC